MDEAERDIDWSLTTWEGSRRAQLRHALGLTLRERLEAAQGLADVARRFQEMRERGQFVTVRSDPAKPQAERAQMVREPAAPCPPEPEGLARNILALEKRIEDDEFSRLPLDDALLLRFHSSICADLVPQLAGWRRANVMVGEHEPPDFFKLPVLAREYGQDLQSRLAAAGEIGETLLETLAFAEGRLLFIHPFADFNGRLTRVWLREILRRLDLPPVQLAPSDEPARTKYLTALRAADQTDWRPLMQIWRRRFEDA